MRLYLSTYAKNRNMKTAEKKKAVVILKGDNKLENL